MGGESEREGVTESEAGPRLWAVSTEPDAGLELTDREITTWAEVGRSINWATQAPHPQMYFLKIILWGAWLAHLVKVSDFYFGSGHNLSFMNSSPMSGSVLAAQSLLGILILSLPLFLPPSLSHSAPPWLVLSLSQNKLINYKKIILCICKEEPEEESRKLRTLWPWLNLNYWYLVRITFHGGSKSKTTSIFHRSDILQKCHLSGLWSYLGHVAPYNHTSPFPSHHNPDNW